MPNERRNLEGLAQKKCVPCTGGVDPLTAAECEPFVEALNTGKQAADDIWSVVDAHHLARDFRFPDFASALQFTNIVGALAEEEAHHPDIFLSWGKVGIKLFTHKIDGLAESDFILAAKIEKIER